MPTEKMEKTLSQNGTNGKGYEYDDGEKLFDFWHTAPSGMFKSAENASPENKFDQNSTGEEVMGWWIK